MFSVSHLYDCIENGDTKRLEEIIKSGYSMDVTDRGFWKYGHSPLGLAIWKGKKRFIQLLVEAGVDLDDFCNSWYKKPLELALEYGYLDIAWYLVENGASVFCNPVCDEKDNILTSPLHIAVTWDDVEFVKILLTKGANPDIKDDYGEIPLFYAKSEAIVQLLLGAGSKKIKWFDLKEHGKATIEFRGPVKIENISDHDQNVFIIDKRSFPESSFCYLTIYKTNLTKFVLLLEDIRNPRIIKGKRIPFLYLGEISYRSHTTMDKTDTSHIFENSLFYHIQLIFKHPMLHDQDFLYIVVAHKYLIKREGVSYDNDRGKIRKFEISHEKEIFDSSMYST